MTARVCFLREPCQVRSLISASGEVLSRSRLISLGLDVSAALEELGLSYETLWDHISAAECRELEREARWLRDNWFRIGEPPLPEWLAEVVSLDRVASSHLFRDALVAKLLFERAVVEGAEEVCICSPLNRAAVCEVVNDVPDAVWAFLAGRAGLSLQMVPFQEHRERGQREKLARETRRLLSFPGQVLERLRNAARLGHLGKGLVIFYVAGSQRRYSGICRALSRILGDRFVPLTKGKLPLTVEGVTYHGIESVVGRPARRWPGGQFSPAELPVAKDYPYIFRNEHLRFHFDHYTERRWPRMASMLKKLDRFFRKVSPRCVLCEDLAYTYEGAMCTAARELGVPAMTVPHSATSCILGVHHHADAALVWTEEYRRALATEGMPGDRVHVVGTPRDMLFGAYPSRDVVREPRGEPRKHSALVLSAGMESGILPFGDMSTYPAVVKELLEVPEELTDSVEVCWKCHPDCDHYYYYLMAARRAKRADVRITRDESLDELVHEADVVVIPGTPTSAYLSALFADKPIVLVTAGQPGPYMHQPAGGRSCVVVGEVADIWPTIRRALFEVEFRNNLVDRARSYRTESAGGPDLLPAEVVAQKISELLNVVASDDVS